MKTYWNLTLPMSELHYELIIVGAGADGLACALAAAQSGQRVLLIEKSTQLGGTVTHSLIHTIGWLYDDEGEYINISLPATLVERLQQAETRSAKRKIGRVWVLNVEPLVYEQVIEAWLDNYRNIRVLREASVQAVTLSNRCLTQLVVTQHRQTLVFTADTFVDATSMAALVQQVDASKGLPAGEPQAGVIFQLHGVANDALRFPKNIGLHRHLQAAVTQGLLPNIFATAWFDSGLQTDEVYIKLNLLASDYTEALAIQWQSLLETFLHQLPDFVQAKVIRRGELGICDGGKIQGKYCLTVDDIKNAPSVTESAGRCAWPMEYEHPETGVTLDYLPPNHTYHIPLSTLQVHGFNNLWAVGKCLSAELRAQASAKVVGACRAMGEAVGKAITQGVTHEFA